MKRVFALLLFLIPVISMALRPVDLPAEENADSSLAPVESRMTLNYLCGSDSVQLTAILSLKKGETTLALENAVVEFTASNGTTTSVLGKAKSDQEKR